MLPVQLEGDQTMAKELQEQDDAAAAAELQTALSGRSARPQAAGAALDRQVQGSRTLPVARGRARVLDTRRALGY